MRLFRSILITGCRFEIGQGLCRILKGAGAAEKVVGSDFTTDHPATLIFDCFELSRRPDHPEYLDSIRRIAHKHEVDLIVPMSEAEIYLFAREGHARSFEGIPVLMADPGSIRIGQDKWTTMEFLREHGIPHPWTLLVGDHDPLAVPCVIKPRQGNEGDGFLIVDDPGLVPILRRLRPLDVWQELLLPEDQEYTCGVFRSRGGEVRSVSLRRRLQGGYTSAGEVVSHPEVDDYLRRVAEALSLQGSVNVQLRLTPHGPRAFEINPRFSSTVMFRHLLGFRDFVWCLKDMKGLPLGPYRPPKRGTRFYRGPREFIVRESGRSFSSREKTIPGEVASLTP